MAYDFKGGTVLNRWMPSSEHLNPPPLPPHPVPGRQRVPGVHHSPRRGTGRTPTRWFWVELSGVPPPRCPHRATDFMVQGGDLSGREDGKGQESIYGPLFDDEGFGVPHDQAGVLARPHTLM